jgi:peptide/nickel transport system permease protein
MVHYVIRRLLNLIPIIFGVAFIFFILFNLVGGQQRFLYNMLPPKGRTSEQIAFYRHKYGLDKPLIGQYLDLVKQMVTFDFGRSESTNQKISFLIARYVPNSAKLTFPAFFLEILVSLTLASLCAYYRSSIVDRVLTVLSVLGMSIAELVLIIIGQKLLSYDLRIFPISGWVRGIGQIRYLVLPWLLWVVVSVGYDIRFFRTTILEEVSKDYVRTARAKGLSERKIMLRHVMKNAMIPILTYVVISIPFLLTGAMLLERFFSIPGIGDLMVTSIFTYDLPVLKATVVVYTLFFVVFSLITDLLYAFVDPRVRFE